jgi:hypothetical protein
VRALFAVCLSARASRTGAAAVSPVKAAIRAADTACRELACLRRGRESRGQCASHLVLGRSARSHSPQGPRHSADAFALRLHIAHFRLARLRTASPPSLCLASFAIETRLASGVATRADAQGAATVSRAHKILGVAVPLPVRWTCTRGSRVAHRYPCIAFTSAGISSRAGLAAGPPLPHAHARCSLSTQICCISARAGAYVLHLHARRPASPPLRRDCIPRALRDVRAHLRRRRVRVVTYDSAACARSALLASVSRARAWAASSASAAHVQAARWFCGTLVACSAFASANRAASVPSCSVVVSTPSPLVASPAFSSDICQCVYTCQ